MESFNLEVIEKREEVQTLSKNALTSVKYAEGLKIKTQEDHDKALADLTKIRGEAKRGDTMRKFFVDPLNDQVKKINALFQPTIKALENAERLIRSALVAYQDELTKKAEAGKAKVMEKIEEGKITVEQGVKKIEKIKEPEKTVRTEAATVSYSMRKVAMTEDGKELDEYDQILMGKLFAAGKTEYLKVDVIKIRKVVLAGVSVPGTKIVEVKTPIVRGN